MHRSPRHRAPGAAALSVVAVVLLSAYLVAGPLDPPAGPVESTGRTVQQIEPRTPVESPFLLGDDNATFIIDQPGHYYLTGEVLGEPNKVGISITTKDVTVDLNGYVLRGVPGSLDGLALDGVDAENVVIRNGTVTNWGADGIDIEDSSGGLVLEDLIVSENGDEGIDVDDGATIRRVNAINNIGAGIQTEDNAIIEDVLSAENGQGGFSVERFATMRDTVSRANGGPGIEATANLSVTGHRSSADGQGITAGVESEIRACVVSDPLGTGIGVSGLSVIEENIVRDAGQAGILVDGFDSVVRSNTVNRAGLLGGIRVLGEGNLIVRNRVTSEFAAYFIEANNRYGPIVNISLGSTPAATSPSAPSTLSTTDPWANLSY